MGWDGADWLIAKPLMDAGRMPHLKGLVENGASGDLLSMPPYISPMLWNTIATGKHPKEHGVAGFVEYNENSRKVEPFQSHQRKCKAIWNILSQQDKEAHVIGWFASHPAEKTNGVCISELFGSYTKAHKARQPSEPGTVYPPEKKERYDEVRIAPQEVDSRLLEFFIPEVTSITVMRDERPQKLLKHLSELYSYHNAAIEVVESESFDFLAVYFHFIDWVCHDFIEYAAPQRPEISDRDFELYRHVVDKAYVLQDMLLGDLLSRVSPDCACMLVSDHGFASGKNRLRKTPEVDSGIAAWHRPEGMLAMRGPGITHGAQINNAKLLDITPTLLHYFGLSVGKDMPGNVLTECFSETQRLNRLSSWEEIPPALEHFRADRVDNVDQDALIAHFAALGYLNLESENANGLPFELRTNNAWNMGQALLNSSRTKEALPYLEAAYYFRPEELFLAEPLARCQIQLGLTEEALATIESLRDHADKYPMIALKVVELYRMAGKTEAALEQLEAISATGIVPQATLAYNRGLCHMRAGAHALALEAYNSIENSKHPNLLNLAKASSLIGLKRYAEAEPLIDAILSDNVRSADAYFFKGQVLAQGEAQKEAQAMFIKALEIDPNYLNAHIGYNRREQEILQRAGRPKPFIAEHFHFDKKGSEKAQIEAKIATSIAKLRAESAKRHKQWENEIRVYRAQELYGKLIKKSSKPQDQTKSIILVTGLPRSGTSLMMQMLAAAGVPIQTDNIRVADASNTKGYFEWEAIKDLPQKPELIFEAANKAVKVVSYQLRYLHNKGNYKIIWMDRPIDAIASSQAAMLENDKTTEVAERLPEIQTKMLKEHRDQTLAAMDIIAQENGTTQNILRINYHDCLESSLEVAQKITAFLGLNDACQEAMVQAVDPELSHQREQADPSPPRRHPKT
jgi:predicted AlkP superfamily phosphohydrolase/phosphomutase/tetratricopeptide (TPR) repeat protein